MKLFEIAEFVGKKAKIVIVYIPVERTFEFVGGIPDVINQTEYIGIITSISRSYGEVGTHVHFVDFDNVLNTVNVEQIKSISLKDS